MSNLMDSKIKYVRYEKGKPWYRRRYPTALRGHPQLEGKDYFRKRIKADPNDAQAFIADWNSLNSAYDTFVSALFNVNRNVIEEAQLTKKALDYLRMIDVSAGMFGGKEARFDGEVKDWLLDEHFDEMQRHYWAERESGHDIDPSELAAIQEEAWRLVHMPKDTPTQYETYSQIFEAYWIRQNMSESNKRDRETKRLRYEFVDVIGGDCIVTSDVLKDHLVKYAAFMRKKEIIFKGSIKTLSESTIKKYINLTRNGLLDLELTHRNPSTLENNESLMNVLGDIPEAGALYPSVEGYSAMSFQQQLKMAARMIEAAPALGQHRQVIMVQMHGFDTHDNQDRDLPKLINAMFANLEAFQQDLEARGLDERVVTFNQSDFGRTPTINANGTDHGWGGHYFMMGTPVKGGKVIGEIPEFGVETEKMLYNLSIPDFSVEQYAANIAKWFGLSASEINEVFPNYARFDDVDFGIL